MRRAAASLALGLGLAACSDEHAGELARLQARGQELFFGRGGCATCHRVGDQGDKIRGPNLGVGDDQTVAVGARARRPGVSGAAYVVESIVDPDLVVVPGYAAGVMRRYDEPPIALSDDDIVALAVFLTGCDGAGLAAARQHLSVARAARK